MSSAHAQGTPARDFDARMAAVAGSGLLTIAALLCALAAVHASTPPALPLAGVAAAALTIALLARRRPGPATPDLSALGGTLLLLTAAGTAPDWAPSMAVLLVGIGIYGAFFLRTGTLILVLTLVAIGYAWSLARAGTGTAALTWVLTTVAVVSTTGLVRWMRQTIGDLLAGLDAAARTDALTGLLNRRGIFERVEHELARSARNGKPLTVLVGDLDSFKALNDGLGHAAGDSALQRVAQALLQTSRRTDAVGRLGGDEFIIVLPETDEDGAVVHAERARQAIVGAFARDPIALDITFGAATAVRPGASVELLLDQADRRLYAAKKRSHAPPVKVAA